ncbi:MAG TPA: ethanolamine ammonia-lyase reactivating factor EutA, partial [Rugosimonospora sp.]|nr:ethanolamine ammonia-lyase reactivating factor EutA [Rugosimonospora sp.]
VAIALAWSGMATFRRLAEVARGIAGGLARLGGTGTVVLACDDDIGRLIGRHVSGRLGGERDVVSIDCIELRQFDFVDVGAILAGSGAVPVVIKSLVFGDAVSRAAAAATARPGA